MQWIAGYMLKFFFLRIFAFANKKEGRVVDFGTWDGNDKLI